MNKVRLDVVSSSKYLGATLSEDGSSTPDIRFRMATATAVMGRQDRIWHSHSIRFITKCNLNKCLVVPILLNGCETWTMLADTERGIQAFESNVPKEAASDLMQKKYKTTTLYDARLPHTRDSQVS